MPTIQGVPGTTSNLGPNAQQNTATGTAVPISVTGLQTPATPLNPVQPTPVIPYDASKLAPSTPPLVETPGEVQQTTLTKQLEALTMQDEGKSAYQSDQENKAGIPALQQSQTDLATQLETLQNQAKAIPLQVSNNFDGRASVGFESGASTAALRTNAIQSLNVSAQIDATNGLLSAAHQKVTSAIQQQYGPIEAQMAALTTNLNLIKNDPQTSVDDKNRAQTQLDSINVQKEQIAQAKQNQTDISTIGITAASNGKNFTATTQYPTLATALSAIQNAPDKVTATNIATQTGLIAPTKLDTSVVDVGGRKVLVNNQTGATIKDLGSSTSGSGTGKAIVSGTLNYSAADQAEDTQALDQARGTDGYTDPTIYQNLYKAWIAAGGRLEGFLSTYPPKNYINPANTWLPSYLMPAKSGGADFNSL